jgi:hypothetical protein
MNEMLLLKILIINLFISIKYFKLYVINKTGYQNVRIRINTFLDEIFKKILIKI